MRDFEELPEAGGIHVDTLHLDEDLVVVERQRGIQNLSRLRKFPQRFEHAMEAVWVSLTAHIFIVAYSKKENHAPKGGRLGKEGTQCVKHGIQLLGGVGKIGRAHV